MKSGLSLYNVGLGEGVELLELGGVALLLEGGGVLIEEGGGVLRLEGGAPDVAEPVVNVGRAGCDEDKPGIVPRTIFTNPHTESITANAMTEP